MAKRNIDPTTGVVSWSTAKQADVNTAASLSTGRSWPRCDKGVIVAADPWYKLDSNRGSVSGGREPDTFYRGRLDPIDLPHSWTAMDADNLATVAGFHFADPNAADQKGSTGIYKHTGNMAPQTVYEMPYVTTHLMRGDETNGRDKLLLYGGVVDTLKISANVRDDSVWKLDATVKHTGKFKRNIAREGQRLAAWSGTSITLSALGVEGSDAATRLRSIHTIKADFAGNGRTLEDVTATVASDATPCVITVTPARKNMVSVYTDVGDDLTTMGNGSTAATVTLNTTDYIYFMADEPLDGAYFDIGANPNALAVTADVEYYNNEAAWTNVGDLLDNTASGGATLAVDGDMFWNKPTDQERIMLPISNSAFDSIDKQPGYWYRLCTSGATTADTTITAVYRSRYQSCDEAYFYDISGTSYTDYTTEWNSMDGSEAPAVTIEGTAQQDYVYVGCYSPISRAYIQVGDTTQDIASTMTVSYYNGSWTSVAGLSDGTDVGGDSLKQSGAVTWTQSTDDEPVAPNTAMTEMYWYRFEWDADLTAGAYIEGIRVGDIYMRVWVTYRVDESVSYTEGQSSNIPNETVIPPFNVKSSQFFYGAYFDGTEAYGGTKVKCDMNTFEYNSSWGTPAPQRCMDGTDNAFPTEWQMGSPTQTVKIGIVDKYTQDQLRNAYTDENPNNSTTDSVAMQGLYWVTYGPIIDTTYGEERYKAEFFWPFAAMQSKMPSQGDGRYEADMTWEIGEDNDNSYYSVYYRIISEQSTNYAQ